MKTKITLLQVVIALYAWAQERKLVDGTGVSSCFSKIESGSFKGQLRCIQTVATSKIDFLTVNYYADLAYS